MTTMPKKDTNNVLRFNVGSGNQNAVWICYRCNLRFYEESIAGLHNRLSNHSPRKIEFSQRSEAIA